MLNASQRSEASFEIKNVVYSVVRSFAPFRMTKYQEDEKKYSFYLETEFFFLLRK